MDSEYYLKLGLENDPELKKVLQEIKDGKSRSPELAKSAREHEVQTIFLMRLLLLRRAAQLTQAELATKVGIPQSSLARIESGKANPTLKTLLKITEALEAQLVLRPRP